MYKYEVLLLVFILVSKQVNNARILGVFPMPSLSHQIVFRAMTFELAKRGHDVVVITPNPAFPNQKSPANYTEIDASSVYDLMGNFRDEYPGKRGAVISSDMFSFDLFKPITSMAYEMFKLEAVKDLIADTSQKFDLVIVESFFHLPLMLCKRFNAPSIWFSSFYGQEYNFEAVGSPTIHPFLYPNAFRDRLYNLSFWEKLYNFYSEFRIEYHLNTLTDFEETLIKDYYGDEALSIRELRDLVDLVFINTNPIYEGNRPVPPNVVYLGALHLQPMKKLPKEWQNYLDSSTRGVIYVSLGTNVYTKNLDPELLNAFLDAFEALPYDILWKVDTDDLPKKPKNLRIEKWFPQRDLLHHPNVKLFITQGGLQSTDEAIDAAVPLVGIPMLGDQWVNVEQYVRLGIGAQVDAMTLDAETLVHAVSGVIGNQSYQENIKRLRNQIKDQPETPLERAIWWTEYVLRHKGAKHLRSMAANMTWSQYLEIGFVLKLMTLVTVIVIFLILSLRYAITLIFINKYKKLKKP